MKLNNAKWFTISVQLSSSPIRHHLHCNVLAGLVDQAELKRTQPLWEVKVVGITAALQIE